MTGDKTKWFPVDNIVWPVQGVKSNHNGIIWCIIYNMELFNDWFNNFHGFENLIYLLLNLK